MNRSKCCQPKINKKKKIINFISFKIDFDEAE